MGCYTADGMLSQVDLTRSDVARYIQLSTLFRRRIEQGVWQPGARLPTVDALAADCGVARATIRQAMDALEADGLIERFRARGTFVRATLPERLWCEVETDWTGLLRSRPGARIELLAERAGAMPPVVPEGMGALAPAYRHLRRRHWRDGAAFLLADVYLDERLWPRVRAADLSTKTALSLVAGLRGVRHRRCAADADDRRRRCRDRGRARRRAQRACRACPARGGEPPRRGGAGGGRGLSRRPRAHRPATCHLRQKGHRIGPSKPRGRR